MNKKRILKFIRNVVISAFVLLVLLIAAGIAYTWYMGQNSVAATVEIIEPTPGPDFTPVKQADNVPTGASVQMITSPVKPGSNASMTVKTNGGAVCTISVIYDKTPSADSGLTSKTADEYGMVSWSWTVESSVPIGKWPAKVTCLHNERTGVVIGYLVVSNTVED